MKTLLLAFALMSTTTFAASNDCNRINDITGLTVQQKQSMVITCEQERLKALESVKEPAKTVVETVQSVTPEVLSKNRRYCQNCR